MKKEELKKYLECFNKDFFTKMQLDKPKLLIDVFEEYIYSNFTYADTKNKFDELEQIEMQIESLNNKEFKNIFEHYIKLEKDFSYDLQKQAFIYGYCICKELNIESKISNKNF